ncbi:MAG: universal stress protein, partial [Deltaproteobacteria bacterium]|nr:universal stress protein [Deltaproteobacteria bacterium]
MVEDSRIDSSVDPHRSPRERATGETDAERTATGWRVPGDPETPQSDKGIPHHLLVCLDRSPESERLIRHATALAKAWEARVTLIHVLESIAREGPPHPADAVDWCLRREEARRYLAEVMSIAFRPDLKIRMALAEGHAFEEINAWSKSNAVDLMILSTHGNKGPRDCG